MFKKDLRIKYSKLRATTTSEELISLSLKIANKLLEIPIWSLDYYHIFLSISQKKEIDTGFVLSILQGKDKNVVIPKIMSDNHLANFLLTDHMRIVKNKWGVPEPVDGIEVPATKIDVVFLPLLAFDRLGNRVGYGKGFYDTFLKSCKPDVLKIGLSIFDAEEKISDLREDDIPMDYCITPDRIYNF